MVKLETFREGMLVCALVDPANVNSHEVFEVLAIGPDGMYCRDGDGLHIPFFPDEIEKCRIFQVGHVERGWFGRKRWVYGGVDVEDRLAEMLRLTQPPAIRVIP